MNLYPRSAFVIPDMMASDSHRAAVVRPARKTRVVDPSAEGRPRRADKENTLPVMRGGKLRVVKPHRAPAAAGADLPEGIALGLEAFRAVGECDDLGDSTVGGAAGRHDNVVERAVGKCNGGDSPEAAGRHAQYREHIRKSARRQQSALNAASTADVTEISDTLRALELPQLDMAVDQAQVVCY